VDIIEFSKIIQPTFISLDLSLEFAGLLLAILSFSGAIHKIENALNNLKDRVRELLPFLRGGIIGYMPTTENIKRNGLSFIWTAVMTVGLSVAVMLTEPETRQMLANIYALILPWAWWKIISLIILLPVVFYFSVIIGSVIVLIPIYFIMTMIWFIFWMLSRPPSGIMGSIGLALTLGTVSVKLFAA